MRNTTDADLYWHEFNVFIAIPFRLLLPPYRVYWIILSIPLFHSAFDVQVKCFSVRMTVVLHWTNYVAHKFYLTLILRISHSIGQEKLSSFSRLRRNFCCSIAIIRQNRYLEAYRGSWQIRLVIITYSKNLGVCFQLWYGRKTIHANLFDHGLFSAWIIPIIIEIIIRLVTWDMRYLWSIS